MKAYDLLSTQERNALRVALNQMRPLNLTVELAILLAKNMIGAKGDRANLMLEAAYDHIAAIGGAK